MSCSAVFVCTGNACRRDRKANKALAGALPKGASVEQVKCQKICKGPVVGLQLDRALMWFGQLSTERALDALGTAVKKGKLKKPLKKRQVEKRSGRMR